MTSSLPFLDAETVRRLLPFADLVPALAAAHRERVEQEDAVLMQEGDHAFLTLPAWRHGAAMGAKLATVFPENAATARHPAVQAVYVLFDGTTGAPKAVIDGTALTYAKTAADSGAGAAWLAREDAETLLMVGAGGLAPHVIAAHRAARPSIRDVLVWNRSPAKAEALAAGIGATAVPELEPAARRADVISCATNATEPLIRGAWLKPGAHLDLIGSYMPDMRETDADAFRRGGFWCDGRRRALADSGEVIDAIREGALTEASIIGDLADLATGACRARDSAEEITIYKNAGGGHLDLMCAEILAASAGLD